MRLFGSEYDDDTPGALGTKYNSIKIMKTLIVEDVHEARELLHTQLHLLGHEVTACSEPESALSAYRKEFYALIIMDLGLPGMNGLELCRRIRSLPKGELSMILMVTGYDEPDVLRAVLDVGADDYLVKPINVKTLQIRTIILERHYQQRVQRRKVQEELLGYREQLEERVERRTAELKQMNDALHREIAERKRVKHSLDDSEARYKILFESAPDLIFTLDENGNFCSVNRKTVETLGKRQEDILGKNLRDFFPEDIIGSRLNFLQKIFHTKRSHRFTDAMIINTPRGKKWFSTNITPIKDPQGHVTYVLGIGRDITKRKLAEKELEIHRAFLEENVSARTAELKQANILLYQNIAEHTQTEKALRESEANLRSILDNSRQSFILLNRNYIIQALNQTAKEDARRLYHLEIAEGTQIDPAMFYGDSESVNTCFQKALNGEFVSIEQNVKGKNNLHYWFVFQYHPVKTNDGQVIGVCLASSDITVRKQMELNLKETKESAEGANKAKSEFLTNMSHELRTPLNIILGYTQILKKSELAATQRPTIETIQRSGTHLLRLVDDILDFSRLDIQTIKLKATDFHLPMFLKHLIESNRQKAQQKNLDFYCEIMSELPEGIHADQQRLRQLLNNLLDNAIKFTQKGKVILRVGEISTTHEDESDVENAARNSEQSRHDTNYHVLRFQVEDTGIGIAQEQWNKVFLPFYQIPHQWLPKAGTGLGLIISRKLARMMGGELYVESIGGQGSVFWCDLKFPDAKGPLQPLKLKEPQFITGINGRKRTLLLADNDEQNRQRLKDMLLPLGFDIIEAINGCDAIEKAKKWNPDLIMIDLVMPIMDGFEAIRRIRRIPELEGVIILAISTSAFAKSREESFLVGCDDFLAKPLHSDEILERLQVHLGIEWSYETAATADMIEEEININSLMIPPVKDLEALLEFADFGSITGLQEVLDQMRHETPQFLPFILKVERLVKRFEFEEIITILKPFVK